MDADAGAGGRNRSQERCYGRTAKLRPGAPVIELVVVNPQERMSDAAIDWLIEVSHQSLKDIQKKEEPS